MDALNRGDWIYSYAHETYAVILEVVEARHVPAFVRGEPVGSRVECVYRAQLDDGTVARVASGRLDRVEVPERRAR